MISVTYVRLFGGVGAFVTYEALEGGGDGEIGHDHDAGADVEVDVADIPGGRKADPVLPRAADALLRGSVRVSLWVVLAVAFVTGLLSGILGVGGFIRMAALFYIIGVSVPVAVETDLFEIIFSGGIGSFLYAQSGVDLSVVVPLLASSALGAQVGSAATSVVDEEGIQVYFGLMLLGGAVAVAVRQVGEPFGIPVLNAVGLVIVGATLLVGGAVVYSSLVAIRRENAGRAGTGVD